MTGRAEVDRLKQRLDETFKRASALSRDPEISSDFARYLCVLVSGLLEQAVIELLIEYVRLRSPEQIQRHVGQRLRRFTTANAKNVIELVGSFDLDWQRDLESYIVDEYKAAVDSVVNLRHTVAHGRYAGVTMSSVQSYYDRVKKVIDHIADLCLPR
ncbi:MAG: HEPN domain-containing protein [Candidatus Acidiferrum sp.]|jgi:hypothetical protein